MKKINLLFLAAAVIVLGTAFSTLTYSPSESKKENNPVCCEKELNKDCGPEKNKKTGSCELIFENMSRQFISISPL